MATFYTMYKRRPVGDYHVGVCTNTLCAIMGGDLIFERLKDHLDVGNDETTQPIDGRDHAGARRVQRRLRLRPGRDGQLGVLRQPDPGVGGPAGRRAARRRRGDRHPRRPHLQLEAGRAGARRLPRRPGRRGSIGRPGVAGRPRAGARATAGRPRRADDATASATCSTARRPRSVPPSRAERRVRSPDETKHRGRQGSSDAEADEDRDQTGRRTDGRHPHPGALRQLGRRAVLDAGVLRGRAAATRRSSRRSARSQDDIIQRSRTPVCAAGVAPASRPA